MWALVKLGLRKGTQLSTVGTDYPIVRRLRADSRGLLAQHIFSDMSGQAYVVQRNPRLTMTENWEWHWLPLLVIYIQRDVELLLLFFFFFTAVLLIYYYVNNNPFTVSYTCYFESYMSHNSTRLVWTVEVGTQETTQSIIQSVCNYKWLKKRR